MPDYLTVVVVLNSFFRAVRGAGAKFLTRVCNAHPQRIRATLKRFFPENVSIKLSGNVLLNDTTGKKLYAEPYTYFSIEECPFCGPSSVAAERSRENGHEYLYVTCPVHGAVFRKNIKIKNPETFPENITFTHSSKIVPGAVTYTLGKVEYRHGPVEYRMCGTL